MINKKELIQTIEALPNEFHLDDLLDRIIILQKIEVGLEQSQLGKTHSTKDAKEKLVKWLR